MTVYFRKPRSGIKLSGCSEIKHTIRSAPAVEGMKTDFAVEHAASTMCGVVGPALLVLGAKLSHAVGQP